MRILCSRAISHSLGQTRPSGTSELRPLHPQEQTSSGRPGMSEKCQQQSLSKCLFRAAPYAHAEQYLISFPLSGWPLDKYIAPQRARDALCLR